LELLGHWTVLAALIVFLIAYAIVMLEDRLNLPKSVPVLFGAGIVWVLVAINLHTLGRGHQIRDAVEHNLLEYAELMLFVIVAMTYVNTLQERGVFDAIRAALVSSGLSLRALFWLTGLLAFLLSPIADNLTTALVMGSIAVAIGQGFPRFVAVSCINIVVAANAGGAFSPFGDITTLMVWQRGIVPFEGFFALLLPSLVNWMVPASILMFGVEREKPPKVDAAAILERGAIEIVLLFLGTIALTVTAHNLFRLPSAVGMMFGLGALQLFAYAFNRSSSGVPLRVNTPDDVFSSPQAAAIENGELTPAHTDSRRVVRRRAETIPLHTFRQMERVEWDTLMFFYGIILCVGGLGTLGYLAALSSALYGGLGATTAIILIGLLSAVIDNVPVMYSVLEMGLDMSRGEWLLVTLTVGVGGSLLSVGSAAGVALMGQARGVYTFKSHLRWSWAIALGYVASIVVHLVVNQALM